MKTIIYGLFSLFLIGLMIAAGAVYWISTELHKPGPLVNDTLFTVTKGASVTKIAQDLQNHTIIARDWLFIIGTRVTKADKKLRAGEYTIPAKANVLDIINVLVSGKQHQYPLTIPEGLNSYQIITLIKKTPELTGNITKMPKDGTLFPETYHFTKGTSKEDMVIRMQSKMQAILKTEWDARAKNLPLKTPLEAMILASIIEKETGINSERAKVSGVFINRLNRGMKLQTDPTVIYAVTDGGKKPLGRPLYTKDLEKPLAYNTYHITGLPPGPICHPGYDSIRAALHPEKHKYLYFVANGTGGHTFAKTLKEHNRNVAAWRKIKKAQNK